MEGTIAEIRLFAGNFAPLSWAFCQGQLQSIAQNTALFSLVGTTYGGDGVTTFALPNLASRVPVGTGQGPGLSNVILGETGGTSTVTLTTSNLPPHTHVITGTVTPQAAGDGVLSTDPAGRVIGPGSFYAGATDLANMAPAQVNLTASISGGNQPFSNIQPYLGMNYIICLEGIYPSRN